MTNATELRNERARHGQSNSSGGEAHHDASCLPLTVDCEQKVHNFNLNQKKSTKASAAAAIPLCECPSPPWLHLTAKAGDHWPALHKDKIRNNIESHSLFVNIGCKRIPRCD
jgi:hypothetical protein